MQHNWIVSNLNERVADTPHQFDITFNWRTFKELSFSVASDKTCSEIASMPNDFYLGLSGGLDSEYILRVFNRMNVPITPVIVEFGNEIERQRAYSVCDELKYDPIIIKLSEHQFIDCYKKYLSSLGVGYNAVHVLVVANLVYCFGGVLVTGDHFMGDGDDFITDDCYLLSNEWDFYIDVCFPKLQNVRFLLHNPEITYASMPRNYGKWNDHRSTLFGVENRKKIRPVYSNKVHQSLSTLIKSLSIHHTGVRYTKQDFFKLFDTYKI
jgi:hypothetical protein